MCNVTLGQVAKELELQDSVRSKHIGPDGADTVMAQAVEAIIGALYKTQGVSR